MVDDSAFSRLAKNLAKLALSCTVSEIHVFLHFTQKFKMTSKKASFSKKRQMTLCTPSRPNIWLKSLYLAPFPRYIHFMQQITMAVKKLGKQVANGCVNPLSCTTSKINVFLHFMQKFKMATKNGRKNIFLKSGKGLCVYLLGQKLAKIALSLTVSEIF